MEKSTVYIESTVISYFTARRAREIVAAAKQELTQDWWNEALPKLRPFISQFVIDEVSKGDHQAAQKRLNVIEDFEILEINEEVIRLGNRYHAALNIPDKAVADAYHMATAVIHGLDYLVSWNCTHIAAARVRAEIEYINGQEDLRTPIICTPEELMET